MSDNFVRLALKEFVIIESRFLFHKKGFLPKQGKDSSFSGLSQYYFLEIPTCSWLQDAVQFKKSGYKNLDIR